jgi:hypothetical protein
MAKATSGSGDRHKCKTYLFTRQPPAMVEAMNRIAKMQNTTVAAMLGAEAKKIVQGASPQLPKKLQRKLRSLGLGGEE